MAKKEDKQKITVVIRNNLTMLSYVFRYTPDLVVMMVICMVAAGLRGILNNVYGMKFLLDSIQLGREFQEIVLFLLFYVGFNLVECVLNTIYSNFLLPKRRMVLFQRMHTELFKKARELELACYDNPKFYNDFVWATSEANDKALAVLQNTGEFIERMTRVFGVGAIVMTSDKLGLIVVAISLIFSFYSRMKNNQLEYEMDVEQKPLQRKRDYVSRVLYLSDYAKEIRLSHVQNILLKTFSETNDKLIDKIKYYGKKGVMWDLLRGFVGSTLLLDGVYTIYLCYQTIVLKTLTLGTFTALYNGVFDVRGSLNRISDCIGKFQKDSLYIQRFLSFLNYEPQIDNPKNPKEMPKQTALMELKHVDFTYEGNDAATLHDINLTIHPGEKIALVGYNGAGKTTLVKLLMRLYDPSAGSIELAGQNIKDYSVEEYRDYFGVVFQDFQLFAGTIAENVKMKTVVEEDEAAVVEALHKSGLEEKLKQLPDGISTMLTREFSKEGINLSGGEAQKVAIARVFYRDCSMVILDEPSSALDPISEYQVNERMMEAAEDKTVVFISHRLSTTKNADRIVMLEQGRIIEEGSHEELMKLGGKYAEMFELQAEKYKN